MTSTIHRSKYGTYHPAPGAEVAWTVNDTRGYTDGGPACNECGACECEVVRHEPPEASHPACACDCDGNADANECVGLSFAYVCLDGGEALCAKCFEKEPDVEVVECNCDDEPKHPLCGACGWRHEARDEACDIYLDTLEG